MRTKKSYTKPTLRVIELKAEESLAVGCQFSSSPAGSNASVAPCTIIYCYAPGS